MPDKAGSAIEIATFGRPRTWHNLRQVRWRRHESPSLQRQMNRCNSAIGRLRCLISFRSNLPVHVSLTYLETEKRCNCVQRRALHRTPRQRSLDRIEHDNTSRLPRGAVVAGSSLGQWTKMPLLCLQRELIQNCTIGTNCGSGPK